VISLERRVGRPLRIGHRGAATLAPENTLAAFRAAAAVGVDLVEFDVIAGSDGSLLVAHGLRDVGPDTPSLHDALRFFVDEEPELGVHLDLKVTGRERDVVAALRIDDLVERSFVSSGFLATSRAIGKLGGPRVGITIPRRVFHISEHGRSAPIARWSLRALRGLTPPGIGPMLALTRATAVTLHHSLVTPGAVRAAHRHGAAVVTWTVDDPAELARVDAAGVDAVVTNDPRIFVSTLKS
jgi:glycerophosphoryl diester phosphodiesterase